MYSEMYIISTQNITAYIYSVSMEVLQNHGSIPTGSEDL